MDIEHTSDYEEGLRDGRLKALEHRIALHEIKADNHERRLMYLEKIVAGFVAIVFLSTIWPKLEAMLSAVSK
jgi:hypothetical protein